MPLDQSSVSALELLGDFQKFWAEAVRNHPEGVMPNKPGPRVPLKWPPPSVALEFHVQAADWTERLELEVEGEKHLVELAYTRSGVFGRFTDFGNDARADSAEKVLRALANGVRPWLKQQREIGQLLGSEGTRPYRSSDCSPIGLVRLLYAVDRDISHYARLEIESHASMALFGPTLLAILADRRHPQRRAAQWAVLDLMEDLRSFFPTDVSQEHAIEAIRDLMWDATDDFARTIYKAGIVLGGHVCTITSAEALLECLHAPSRYGRRSAIHACFHLNEWMPELKERIATELERVAQEDPEGILRGYAEAMAEDIRNDRFDHFDDVFFPEEA